MAVRRATLALNEDGSEYSRLRPNPARTGNYSCRNTAYQFSPRPFPAGRSGSTAVSGASRKSQIHSSKGDAMIENIDDNFGLLMKKLDEWNHTLVIFMTDNGATHLSGKLVKHFNTGLKGAKNSPYQGGNHVPTFRSLQGVTGAGISVNGLTACIEDKTPKLITMKKRFFFTTITAAVLLLLGSPSLLSAQDPPWLISDGSHFVPKDFYPKYSWDTTPQYFMFQDKALVLSPKEVEFIASRTDFLCIEKSHGKGQLGAAELGAKHEAAAFKMVKPDSKVLFYFNSAYAWTYTSYSKDFTKDRIESHPELKKFLITNPKTGALVEHFGAFCFDVLNPEFREWWVETVAKGVRESDCDGVFIDQMHGNVRFRKEKAKEIEKAMGEMMAALKKKMGANKILLGNNANNSDAKFAYPVCDAIMFENYAASRFTKENLLSEWKDMLRIAQDGKILVFRLGVDGTGRGNLKPGPEMITLSKEKLEFARACYLIGAQPYSYFMYSWGWKLSTGPLVDYPEFKKPLGPLKGAYKRTTPDGWEFTREFEHASVRVNIESREAKITWR